MSTRVVTISTCDRCGTIADAGTAAREWDSVWNMLLCPACVTDVRFVLEDKPGARVPPVRQEEAPGETGQMSREGVE